MTATSKKYHHGDLRSALLDAALSVIGELGPQVLTIREVARRAGVSHAAPYRHFKDKDELILAVVEQGFSLMLHTMQVEKDRSGEDPLSQFAAGGLAYVDFALSHPAYYRIMFSGDLLSTTGHVSFQHTSREAIEDVVADIERCQALGFVRQGDPRVLALTILSTLHGFVSLVNDNRIGHLVETPRALDDLRDHVLGLIYEGIGPGPADGS